MLAYHHHRYHVREHGHPRGSVHDHRRGNVRGDRARVLHRARGRNRRPSDQTPKEYS